MQAKEASNVLNQWTNWEKLINIHAVLSRNLFIFGKKGKNRRKNIIEFIFSLLIIFDFDNYHEDVQLPMV